MGLNSNGYCLLKLAAPAAEILRSFEDLPPDPYCSHRFRRFSQFRAGFVDESWRLEPLPHRPHIQPVYNNPVMGGVLRKLAPMESDASGYLGSIAAAIPLDTSTQWQVDIHQWRTVCRPGSEGVSVPEGPHQDGHELGAILVIRRGNLSGGRTRLSQPGQSLPFFERFVAEGEALIFDDRKLAHFTTNVHCNGGEGFRDIFVLNLNRWENRRYGPEFEAFAMSGEEAGAGRKASQTGQS